MDNKTKTINEMCRKCKGAKTIRKSKQPCSACKGTGTFTKEIPIEAPRPMR